MRVLTDQTPDSDNFPPECYRVVELDARKKKEIGRCEKNVCESELIMIFVMINVIYVCFSCR